jgi:hypothetical protein
VLLEHFTDTQIDISRQADSYFFNLEQNQLSTVGSVDFTTLEYHINNSGGDLFNEDNSGDPSARSLYYGVSQAPRTVLDGSNEFADNPFSITDLEIDKRALLNSLFNVIIDTLSNTTVTPDVLSVEVEFEANTVINDAVTLQIAVVETDIVRNGVTYRNVLKKLLLGGEGQTINSSWTAGQKQTISFNWNIDVEIFNPDNLYIIAFVQNKTTREIYGTAKLKGQFQDESTITAIGEDILNQAKQIVIYPNPASEQLNFQLTERPLDNYGWKIVDQRGVVIKNGSLNFNPLGLHTVNTSELRNGVYYVIIESENKPLIYRKLAILNRR